MSGISVICRERIDGPWGGVNIVVSFNVIRSRRLGEPSLAHLLLFLVCALRSKETVLTMLHYALMFLIVGLIAGALGLVGVAAVAGQIAWILFLVGIILIVVHMARGRHLPPPA
jgi:uncharacterized membrane protein YtjA (UPF0391 family)